MGLYYKMSNISGGNIKNIPTTVSGGNTTVSGGNTTVSGGNTTVSGGNTTVSGGNNYSGLMDLSSGFLTKFFAQNTNENQDSLPLFVQVFNNSYIMSLVWFLAIYLVIYAFFLVFLNPRQDPDMERKLSARIDMMAFAVVFVFVVYQAFTTDLFSSQTAFNDGMITFLKDFYGNQLSLFSTMLFLVVFYLLIFILRVPTGNAKPWSIRIISFLGTLFLISVFIYDFFKYFLGYDMLDMIGGNNNPILNAILNEPTLPPDQVFNVSNNLYSYDDAKAVCKAFNSRLSTYDEIETAYNNGAEWCNYGWSEGQMAYFPTQKNSWNKLQKSELNKNSCGRPGINGGFMANPNIRFGVNCFGQKPAPTAEETALMAAAREIPIPQTPDEIALDEKAKYYKENASKLIQVNSFNKNKWSRY